MKNLLINRALAAKKKKIFTLLLAVAAGIGTMFASTKKIGDLYYNLDATNQTAEVIVGRELTPVGFMNYPSLKTATIPASVTYSEVEYSVTSIGDSAFYNCSLASVTIPNSVTSIGNSAFSGCIYLTSVTIGNSVTSIGNSAFSGCIYLTSVTIGNSVTSIGSGAFYGCKGLTSVTIPNSVTSIGGQAFYGCKGLTSVTIPNSVTSIGDRAFSGCSGLTSINVETNNPNYCSVEGVLFNKDKTRLIQYPGGKQGAYTIPNTVTSIGDRAFSGCSGLTSVTIPNSITSIGDYAFYGCRGLISVTIPNSVTSIGNSAFSGCSSLTSVTIPNSVTTIGEGAFYGCNNLMNVIIGSSVKVLEASAFANCTSIETITCYSMRPPTVNTDALYGLDYSTIVYVPADYLNTYQMHDAWGLYDVRPLGAKGTETTDIKVTPADKTAEVAWPQVSGAATYELVIKDKSGNVICTLVFNANGQLTSIAFAPSHNNAPQQTQATGFSFTVTGLEEGTSYDLTITSKNNNGSTLDTKTISFTTSGEQGIDQVPSDQVQSTKVIKNGQIFILRGDKTYTLTGQETIMP